VARERRGGLLLALEIAALGAFVWRKLVFEPWRVSGRSPAFSFAVLAGLLIVLAFVVSRSLKAAVSFLASKTQADEAELKRAVILALSPFLLLGLTFLQGVFNLNDIDPALLAVSGLGSVYLFLVLWASSKSAGKRTVAAAEAGTHSGDQERQIRKLSRRLFLAAALVYVVYLSGLVAPALPFTGDEPHYLLTTESLLSDGDLNVANNYRNKDYLKFYPGDLEPHAYPGKKGDLYLYSKHQPALSVLVAPFYFLGEKWGSFFRSRGGNADRERNILIFFSRLPVCFLAAFLSLVFFLSVWEMTRKKSTALLSWLVFSFCPPLLFYSHLLYPEIPVALILLWITLQSILKKNFSPRILLGAGIGIGLLPWCGIKYIVLAAAMALILSVLLLKQPERDIKKAFALYGPVLLSAGLYAARLFRLYGTLSAQAVYSGATPEASLSLSHFVISDFRDFLSRFLGYLFDQRAGLFIIAPVYVLLLPGFLFLARKFKKETLFLAGLFSAFWIFCSLNYFYWGGFCPPGRPLLPVLWVLALFTAGAFADSRNLVSRVGRDILVAVGFFIAAVFIRNPSLLFQESLGSPRASLALGTGSPFLARFNNVLIDWRTVVPSLSFPSDENANWLPLLLWIPAALGIAALFLLRRKSSAPASLLCSLRVHLGGWAVAAILFVGNAVLNIGPEQGLILKGQGYEVVAQDKNVYPEEMGGFWVRGKSRAALIIKTVEPAAGFNFSLSSPIAGETTVRLAREAKLVERKSGADLEQSLVFSSPRGFRWKGNTLYRLQVEEKSGFYPWRIEPGSQDGRHLGVFIKLQVRFFRSGPG
jgi:hypothetical protein